MSEEVKGEGEETGREAASVFPFLSSQPLVHVLPNVDEQHPARLSPRENEEEIVKLESHSENQSQDAQESPSQPSDLPITPTPSEHDIQDVKVEKERPGTAYWNYLLLPVDNFVLLQQLFRRALAVQELRKREKQERMRTTAATEIFTTEKGYVTSLQVLMGLYMHPLMIAIGTPNEILTKQEFNEVFPNVELIINLNKELLRMVQERIDQWHPHQKIGDIFLKLAAFFKMYSAYCEDYEKAITRAKQLQREKPRFDTFLKKADSMKNINDGLDLASFLIKPIQRLPRYILLLDALLKYTPEEHPDRVSLTDALSKLQTVTSHVNEAMRNAARMEQLVAIENRFGMTLNLIQPDRRFIREGKLGKITSRMVVRPTYFLFNDILVYGYDTISGGLVHKGTIPLNTTWVRDLKDSGNVKYAWQIVAVNKTYTVFAASEKEKKEWMHDLDETIAALVAIDPSLVSKRNRKITITDRGAKFFWSLFTYDARSIDPMTDQEQEQQVNQKQQDDIALARARSSTLLPISRSGPTAADASIVPLEDEWQDVKGGGSLTLPARLPSQTLQALRQSASSSSTATPQPPPTAEPAPSVVDGPLISLAPDHPKDGRPVSLSTKEQTSAAAHGPQQQESITIQTPVLQSSPSTTPTQAPAPNSPKISYNLNFGGEERTPLLESDGTPRARQSSTGTRHLQQPQQSDDSLCSWCTIS
eukprot:TRINITY_DN2399_c0_g1_i1.p1 TRINITY_DN2399_c0_g1~~TRINITY_DN2399_c0_g1_i1.p1  ORF type:complete len:704 (-),score=122.41 TRINITY_DN2399_c0_g1_i1:6-2117(-)